MTNVTKTWKPGDEVGAGRWPWKGIILAPDDPKAWEGTLAFPRGLPDRDAVRAHLARHPELTLRAVPVVWEFGLIEWERLDALRPYADDVAAREEASHAASARAGSGTTVLDAAV
jgi:hypothetical protein